MIELSEETLAKMKRVLWRVAMIIQIEKVAVLLTEDNRLVSNGNLCFGMGEVGEIEILFSGLAYKTLMIDRASGVEGLISSELDSDFERDYSTGGDFACCGLWPHIFDENGVRTSNHDESIGVMYLFNKRHEQLFNADDLRLLGMLADQIAEILRRDPAMSGN
jgi:hypothetical protein